MRQKVSMDMETTTITYENQYGQRMTGEIVRRGITGDGSAYIIVKREDWPNEEPYALSDFEDGTLTLIDGNLTR
jgi:hypothetical protein